MKLNKDGVFNHQKDWEEKGYILPKFDYEEMVRNTNENPIWVHFGAGNIFRAFQANLAQGLLDLGEVKSGIIAVDGFDYEIATKAYRPHDSLSIAVTLKADGTIEKKVIGSIAKIGILDSNNEVEFNDIVEVFKKPSLQMASFTITEKGYSLTNANGVELEDVTIDKKMGPNKPNSYIGKVVALLYARYKAGKYPIAMVSMDNCSHNGDKLFQAVENFVKAWVDNGLVEKEFYDYIKDENKVSFPWSMIDKITPRPDKSVEEILRKDGIEKLEAVVTSRKTFVAPFVNAEESEYLVIEDKFPNGKLPLDKVGVYFTDKDTVNNVEKMKVCTCLNPLHTTLAIFGCLLGYEKISDEMKDDDLVKLVKQIGYVEGLPVVVDPKIIDPKEFIDTVLQTRLPNPFMPDTPQRIATDTSQKLSIIFGETIKAYLLKDKTKLNELKGIPLVLAGWLRYLLGINDNGEAFEISPDPLLESCQKYVEGLALQEYEVDTLKDKVLPLLKNVKIFGVDLEEVGLSDTILNYLKALLNGKGAIRNTISKVVNELGE